jgi:hypothetical protein
MKNITITIPDETYRQARVWAAERATSVSRVVAYILQTLPGHPRANKQFPNPDRSQVSSAQSSPLS